MKLKKFWIGFLVLAFFAPLISCARGNDSEILGTWVHEEHIGGDSILVTMTFYADGRFSQEERTYGQFGGRWDVRTFTDAGTFEARNGQMRVTFDGEVEEMVWTYVVSGNVVRIDFDGESITLRRP